MSLRLEQLHGGNKTNRRFDPARGPAASVRTKQGVPLVNNHGQHRVVFPRIFEPAPWRRGRQNHDLLILPRSRSALPSLVLYSAHRKGGGRRPPASRIRAPRIVERRHPPAYPARENRAGVTLLSS